MAKSKFEDWEELNEWLQSLEGELQKKINKITKTYASKMTSEATKNAPVKTGTLRGSIKQEPLEYDSNGNVVATVKVGAEYGFYVEFGTSTHKAQPYFYPAFYKYRDRYVNALIKEFKKTLEE